MSFEITAAQAAQAVSAVHEINDKIEDRIARMGRSGIADEAILGAINKASSITSAVLQYARAQGETFDPATVLTIPFDRPKRSRIEAAFRGVLGPKSLAALSAFVEDDVDDGLNIDTAALAAMGIEI